MEVQNHQYHIYTLSEPRTGEVRYVGITRQKLKKRLSKHISFARQRPNYYVSAWINRLLEADLYPEIKLLETTNDLFRERFWIQKYREQGARLTNLSDGCEGQVGVARSEETRQKISRAGEKRCLDLRGQKFGRLSPVEIVSHKPVRWLCRCDCGQETTVPSITLRSGGTQSCGCLNRELAAERTRSRAVHGKWQTSEYHTWVEMKARCYNSSHVRFPRLGGLGIGVCERWRESFPDFIADMGNRPEGYVLIRKDIAKDFSPDNCEWVTKSQRTKLMYERNSNRSLC